MRISPRKALDFAVYFLAYIIFSVPYVEKMFFKKRKKVVGFAFDYFTGNIKYLYQEMKNYPSIEVYFVTTIKKESQKLKSSGVNACYYRDLKKIPLFLTTDVWVTSHGPNYIPFRGLRRVIPFYTGKRSGKWVCVWHGLAFVHTERERILKDYDLGFVTSEFFKKYYSKESGISDKLEITGYPRTDPLLNESWVRDRILKDVGVPLNKKNILYAPTWGHEKRRSFFPWEENIGRFIGVTESFCEKNRCNFLIRMHPNWYRQNMEQKRELEDRIRQSKNIFHLPIERCRDVQPILYISDVLITDWSSIANDFILLDRPIVFLDVELPVERFVLKPRDRVGYIVQKKKEFFEKIQEALNQPKLFEQKRRVIIKKLYKHLDGNSSKRCAQEILKLLGR